MTRTQVLSARRKQEQTESQPQSDPVGEEVSYHCRRPARFCTGRVNWQKWTPEPLPRGFISHGTGKGGTTGTESRSAAFHQGQAAGEVPVGVQRAWSAFVALDTQPHAFVTACRAAHSEGGFHNPSPHCEERMCESRSPGAGTSFLRLPWKLRCRLVSSGCRWPPGALCLRALCWPLLQSGDSVPQRAAGPGDPS